MATFRCNSNKTWETTALLIINLGAQWSEMKGSTTVSICEMPSANCPPQSLPGSARLSCSHVACIELITWHNCLFIEHASALRSRKGEKAWRSDSGSLCFTEPHRTTHCCPMWSCGGREGWTLKSKYFIGVYMIDSCALAFGQVNEAPQLHMYVCNELKN